LKLAPLAWLLSAVPLVGLVELALHVRETGEVVPDADWVAARELVKADFKPDDLVLFAPFWADPLGREFFGDDLAGIKREARPDETRFARAYEVSIRGQHRSEIAGWKKVSERSAGKVTIGLYENPAPARVLTDLVDLVHPDRLTVTRVEGGVESPCGFQRGTGQPGGLGVPQGVAIPGDRFVCGSGGYVGVAVLHALDHHPHLCIFAAAGPVVRLRFSGVVFGASLHGHSGVQWLVDRSPNAERITVAFSAFDRSIGVNPHRVGTGWTAFELPTEELAGKRGDLIAEVTGGARHYCFEADTR
jgi:hypothetical protein